LMGILKNPLTTLWCVSLEFALLITPMLFCFALSKP
jgi:hypothetical protein